KLSNGDEIFAIEPSAVKEIDYETPRRAIAAIRPPGGEAPFIMIEKDSTGRVIRRCSREGFDQTFGELYSIRIRSQIAGDRLVALRTGENTKLRILSVIEGQPSEWSVAPDHEREPQLALLVGRAAYELALSPRLVALLANGCGSSSGGNSQR